MSHWDYVTHNAPLEGVFVLKIIDLVPLKLRGYDNLTRRPVTFETSEGPKSTLSGFCSPLRLDQPARAFRVDIREFV